MYDSLTNRLDILSWQCCLSSLRDWGEVCVKPDEFISPTKPVAQPNLRAMMDFEAEGVSTVDLGSNEDEGVSTLDPGHVEEQGVSSLHLGDPIPPESPSVDEGYQPGSPSMGTPEDEGASPRVNPTEDSPDPSTAGQAAGNHWVTALDQFTMKRFFVLRVRI